MQCYYIQQTKGVVEFVSVIRKTLNPITQGNAQIKKLQHVLPVFLDLAILTVMRKEFSRLY